MAVYKIKLLDLNLLPIVLISFDNRFQEQLAVNWLPAPMHKST